MEDNVNHPKHYETSTSIECIEMMECAFGPYETFYFCKLNAFKYIWRHKNKNGLEDLEKAKWYLTKATTLIRDNEDLFLSEDTDSLKRLADLLAKKVTQWQESN